MKRSLENFPIDGITCSNVLNNAATSEKNWILSNIETLTDVPALALGDLWEKVQNGPLTITTSNLCKALDLASQVIILDVRLAENPSIQLYIDDGLMIECNLP